MPPFRQSGTLVIEDDKNTTTLYYDEDIWFVQKNNSRPKKYPVLHVLSAKLDTRENRIEVVWIARKYVWSNYSVHTLHVRVEDGSLGSAHEWADRLVNMAYRNSPLWGLGLEDGTLYKRKFKVIVNPYGGVGKAIDIYQTVVQPILEMAGCILDVTYTTHAGHASEIATTLPLDIDAIICVSGDGVIHEILNGFTLHENPDQVFAIPIAPIPTGSGNGLAINLLGLKRGFDVVFACLNAIKGRPMAIDVFSFIQKGVRSLSFMSQAVGLMADLDIGTEHLRWMGDTRFAVGLLRGLIRFKPCPVQVSYIYHQDDKHSLFAALEKRYAGRDDAQHDIPSHVLLKPHEFHDGLDFWYTVEEPLVFLYAGKGPYVGRDYMPFPMSVPDDGLADLVLQTHSSRLDILSGMFTAHKGYSFFKDSVIYTKVKAYKVKALKAGLFISVDGESYPLEEYQVEVHRKMARVLSLYGNYASDFHVRAKKKLKKQKPKQRSSFPGLLPLWSGSEES